MRKYIMTDETIEINGHILHRIESLIDFRYVEKGDEGGYIESEENLSHEGNCWIFDESRVYENAKIKDNVIVCGDSDISGECEIADDVEIHSAELSGICYIR